MKTIFAGTVALSLAGAGLALAQQASPPEARGFQPSAVREFESRHVSSPARSHAAQPDRSVRYRELDPPLRIDRMHGPGGCAAIAIGRRGEHEEAALWER